MHPANQKILQNNLFRALVPGDQLIEGRSETDFLNYLVKVSQVFNFYNQDNIFSGSWQPFLLKDPVFLLVTISNYDVSDVVKLFNKIRSGLNPGSNSFKDTETFKDLLNSLLNINYTVYSDLEKWSEFMLADTTYYEVKNSAISEIRSKFSKLFWAIVALNRYINLNYAEWKISNPGSFRNVFTSEIWRTNKDKEPFNEILGLGDNFIYSQEQVAAALIVATNELLAFVMRLKEAAKEDYRVVSNLKSNHPDTVLLRVVVKLLLKQNAALNTLSTRHLDFYFRTILGQTPKPAVADRVYSDVHSGVDQLVSLTKGTVFNCGTDLNSNPIDYKTLGDCMVNPAVIGNTQTLFKKKLSNDKYQLFQKLIETSDKVNFDENGKILTWNAFGQETDDPFVTSFVCGSPLLYLPGGNRILTLKIKFVQSYTNEVFDKAKFYVSTAEQWVAAQPEISFDKKTSEVVSNFKFDSDFPAIERIPFENSGVQSNWPLLRIDFNWFYEESATPSIEYIIIENSVEKAKDLVLYNQNGLIAALPGLQPFGPSASVNSNLVIGSVEIFSKPVNKLDFTLHWGELPHNFSEYYDAYNVYLSQPGSQTVQNSLVPKILLSLAGWFRRKLFKGATRKQTRSLSFEYFTNECFKTGFDVLENGLWKSYSISSESTSGSATTVLGNAKDNGKVNLVETVTCSLYPHMSTDNTDYEGTHFIINSAASNVEGKPLISGWPELQYEEYDYSENSTRGFSRLYLSSPAHGFGSDIYPAVVAYTATQNGLLISRSWLSGPPDLLTNPQVPFMPVALNFDVNYTASYKYEIKGENTYPLECYYFTPFSKYKVYDSNKTHRNTVVQSGFSLNSQKQLSDSLPLYPSFDGQGSLFVGLQKLVAPSILNLYFEVGKSAGQFDWKGISVNSIDSSGWFDLTVADDETNALSETGILSLTCPDTLIADSDLMPNGFYWFAFTNKSDEVLNSYISYLNTNGIKLERQISPEDDSQEAFHLSPGTMVIPPVAIPAITAVNQPFPSFGGKPKESVLTMNQRVAIEINTKGQMVFKSDYFRLIANNFPEVFYSKVVNRRNQNGCLILLVQKSDGNLSASPFLPIISNSVLAAVNNFIIQRNSVFAETTCVPFGHELVTVEATIIINNTVGSDYAKADINNRLRFYFSPWTETNFPQIAIDSPIYLEEVVQLIRNLPYVKEVDDLNVLTGVQNSELTKHSSGNAIIPSQSELLFVSQETHKLTIKVEI